MHAVTAPSSKDSRILSIALIDAEGLLMTRGVGILRMDALHSLGSAFESK